MLCDIGGNSRGFEICIYSPGGRDLGALGASEALGAVTLGVNAGQNGGRRGPGMERERQSTEHGRITR